MYDHAQPNPGAKVREGNFIINSDVVYWLTVMKQLPLRRFVFRRAEASAKQVTGDKPQGTMGRVQTAGEAPSHPLSPSRLPLRAQFHQKRDVWVRGRS